MFNSFLNQMYQYFENPSIDTVPANIDAIKGFIDVKLDKGLNLDKANKIKAILAEHGIVFEEGDFKFYVNSTNLKDVPSSTGNQLKLVLYNDHFVLSIGDLIDVVIHDDIIEVIVSGIKPQVFITTNSSSPSHAGSTVMILGAKSNCFASSFSDSARSASSVEMNCSHRHIRGNSSRTRTFTKSESSP